MRNSKDILMDFRGSLVSTSLTFLYMKYFPTTRFFLSLSLFISSRVRSMPELPEVETARKHLAKFCEGKRIQQIITREQGHGPRHGIFDDIIYEQTVPEDVKLLTSKLPTNPISREETVAEEPKKGKKSLSRRKTEVPPIEALNEPEKVEEIYQLALKDKWIHQVCRKGKQLWIELGSEKVPTEKEEDKLALLLHFGMTGSIVIQNEKIPCYKAFHVVENETWPPKFAKLELILNDDENTSKEPIRVVLCDPRRLGYIKLRINPRNTSPIQSLAYDPLNEVLPPITVLKEQFFKKSQTNIKTLLLNQEKVFCGIGNYLADEILYQSKIHPLTVASEINEAGTTMMIEKMKYILQTAVDCNADYEDFPKDWIFHYRWEKGKPEGIRHMPNGNPITYETINGRTTAIVLKEQLKTGYYRDGSTIKEETNEEDDENKVEEGKKVVRKQRGAKKVKEEPQETSEREEKKEEELPATTKRGRKRKNELVEELSINNIEEKVPVKRSKRISGPSDESEDPKIDTKVKGRKRKETSEKVEISPDVTSEVLEETKPKKKGRKT